MYLCWDEPDKASLIPLFREIRAATFSFDDPEKKEVRIGGFLDTAKIDYKYDDHGEIKVRWWFSRLFCEVAEKSDHWAIMDRQTVFTLKSKYSILLFQHLASLVNLEHRNSEVLTRQTPPQRPSKPIQVSKPRNPAPVIPTRQNLRFRIWQRCASNNRLKNRKVTPKQKWPLILSLPASKTRLKL